MKKIKYLLVFLSFLFTFIFFGVFSTSATTTPQSFYDWSSTLEVGQTNVLGASTIDQGTPSDYLQFNRYLIGSGLTRSNIFYFIKPLQENIQLTYTFNQKTRDEMRIQFAGERLEEMQKAAVSKNT